jgi:hypothetical protein
VAVATRRGLETQKGKASPKTLKATRTLTTAATHDDQLLVASKRRYSTERAGQINRVSKLIELVQSQYRAPQFLQFRYVS